MLAGYQAGENESAAQCYFSASDLGGAGMNGVVVVGNPNWPIFTLLWEVLPVITVGKQSASDGCVSACKAQSLAGFCP